MGGLKEVGLEREELVREGNGMRDKGEGCARGTGRWGSAGPRGNGKDIPLAFCSMRVDPT